VLSIKLGYACAMRNPALALLAALALGLAAACSDSAEQADAAPEAPDVTPWLTRFAGSTTLTFDVPAGNPIPDQTVATTWVGTESASGDYNVSLDRDDDLDRWFVPIQASDTEGEVVTGYSFGSFIADDPGGNTTVIMMIATGGTTSVAGGLALVVQGTIRAQQGLEVADGTFVATFSGP